MTSILVVEDDDACRQAVCEMLAGHEYVVASARNGHEAMEALGRRPVDIVLTDVLMPDKDGLETIREIVKNFPAVKVAAMSGGGRISSTDYLEIATAFGAAKSIEKPFNQEQLLGFLRGVAGQQN